MSVCVCVCVISVTYGVVVRSPGNDLLYIKIK